MQLCLSQLKGKLKSTTTKKEKNPEKMEKNHNLFSLIYQHIFTLKIHYLFYPPKQSEVSQPLSWQRGGCNVAHNKGRLSYLCQSLLLLRGLARQYARTNGCEYARWYSWSFPKIIIQLNSLKTGLVLECCWDERKLNLKAQN